MQRIPRRIVLVVLTIVTSGCHTVRTSVAATPQQTQAKPNGLTGRWDFRVVLGERSTPGELWLFENGGSYTGTLSPQGTNTLPVRSLKLRNSTVAMTVDTPEGPVTFDGVVDASGSTMQGIVTYHQGQKYPLEAKRRPAAGS